MKKLLLPLLFLQIFIAAYAQQEPIFIEPITFQELNYTSFNGKLFFGRNDTVFLATTSGINKVAKLGETILEKGTMAEFGNGGIRFPTTSSHIFFITEGTTNLFNLWMSDGTTSGTVNIFSADTLSNFISFNNNLYFITEDEKTSGQTLELRKVETDGTTTVVADNVYMQNPILTAGNTFLFYQGFSLSAGVELWQTDGTSVALVQDYSQGVGNTLISDMVTVGEDLYFVKDQDSLFIYDGLDIQFLVASIADGLALGKLTPFNNSLIYSDFTYLSDSLYITSGIPGDTTFLKYFDGVGYFIPVGAQMFFAYQIDGNPLELWKTDGTPEGTVKFAGDYIGGEVDKSALKKLKMWFSLLNLKLNHIS